MELKTLQVFVAVSDYKNLTLAGQCLGYTQSGVSHIIKNLEAELGFSLFSRTTRMVSLNENGRLLLPMARELLRCSDKLDQMVASLKGLDIGSIRIASFTSVSVHWLPPIIKAFQKDYPNIGIQLREGGGQEIERWVECGDADLGFLSHQIHHQLDWIPLAEDEMVAVLPQDHPLGKQERCPVSALEKEPFIMYAAGVDYDMEKILRQNRLCPRVWFSSMDDHTIISMVENGLGVSIMPGLILKGYARNVAIRPLDPPFFRSLGILLPSAAGSSPAVKKFIRYVKSMITPDDVSSYIK